MGVGFSSDLRVTNSELLLASCRDSDRRLFSSAGGASGVLKSPFDHPPGRLPITGSGGPGQDGGENCPRTLPAKGFCPSAPPFYISLLDSLSAGWVGQLVLISKGENRPTTRSRVQQPG